MANSADRSSFWTTVPGLLTGSAALITASAGAFALIASGSNGPGLSLAAPDRTSEPTAKEASDAPEVDAPRSSGSAVPDPPAATDPAVPPADAGAGDGYLLREDGKIDVDSGQFGSGVEAAEVHWSGSFVYVYGDKRVQLDETTDGAGCARALERGLDATGFDVPLVKGGLMVCVRSDQGRLSIVVIDPPMDDGRLPVRVTSFDR